MVGIGFWRVLRAEWAKFWSVRGNIWALGAALGFMLVINIVLGDGAEPPMFSYHLVHQPFSGDGTVVAQVTGQDSTTVGAAAGIIIKETSARTAPYAALFVTPDRGVRLHTFRKEIGGSESRGPRWLKLTRAGDHITGYESADGSSWAEVGTLTLRGLPERVEAGLLVASGVRKPASAARFDNVSLSAGDPGDAWRSDEVGEPGSPGGFTETTGLFTVIGGGEFRPFNGHDPHVADSSLVILLFGLPVILGISVQYMTSEYSRGMMIRTTFAAVPRRGRVLAAKAVVLGVTIFSFMLITTSLIAARLVSNVEHSGIPPVGFFDAPVLRMITDGTLMLTFLGLLSLGIAAIVRRAPAAIVLAIGALLVPTIIAENLPPDMRFWAIRAVPSAAMALETVDFVTIPPPPDASDGVPPWLGLSVLAGWAALALGVAAWRLHRRDA